MNYEKDFNFNHENKQTEQFQIDTLEVKNLTFSYGEKKILKNLNFSFSNGELLGIFGPSGSGKTTLINLIMGFINPTEGKIYVNKEDIKYKIDEWQNSLAYIPQNVCIIKSTIKENIVFENEKNKINEERSDYSVTQSRLDEFVHNLEDKYETQILEDGKNLSGGQKQRIAIARAIYHNKKILIMDEPTSFLDQDLIDLFWNYINEIKNNYTIILVSHDLNLKKSAIKLLSYDLF